MLGSGQQTNEAAHVPGKLARGGFGTRNYDANTTLCMASAVTAYYRAFGSDAPPCTYDDIDEVDRHVPAGTAVLGDGCQSARPGDRDRSLVGLTLPDRDPQSQEPHFSQCAVKPAAPEAELSPMPADDRDGAGYTGSSARVSAATSVSRSMPWMSFTRSSSSGKV